MVMQVMGEDRGCNLKVCLDKHKGARNLRSRCASRGVYVTRHEIGEVYHATMWKIYDGVSKGHKYLQLPGNISSKNETAVETAILYNAPLSIR